jgi:hypothetical protein
MAVSVYYLEILRCIVIEGQLHHRVKVPCDFINGGRSALFPASPKSPLNRYPNAIDLHCAPKSLVLIHVLRYLLRARIDGSNRVDSIIQN